MSTFNFAHGDFCWNVDLEDGAVDWDGVRVEGDEPSEAEIEAAQDHWDDEGYEEYMRDMADDHGDYLYEQWKDNQLEDA